MDNVLNQSLYSHLQRRFTDVRISDQRVEAQVLYRPDHTYRRGALKAEIVVYGETYRVSCPFCSDTRHRLSICHRWGVNDEETHDDMLHLATCFNESCLSTREAQKDLHAIVFPNGMYGRLIAPPSQFVSPIVTPPPPPVDIELPECVPLSRLPKSHPAIRYLRDRGYGARELSEKWEVGFCESNPSERPWFYDPRIVIPIMKPRLNPFEPGISSELELAGWQARTIATETDRPKYLTAYGMKKTRLLYGLPDAKHSEGPVVLMEGVTDVWRYGSGAMALLGKTISQPQIDLIRRHLNGRSIIVLLDGDASDAAVTIRNSILDDRRQRREHAPCRIAKLPEGRSDPGECTKAELRSIVENAISSR